MRRSINRPEYPAISALFEAIRKEAGLTQVELASRMKRSQAFCSSVERGFRRLDPLQCMDWCDACGVTMEKFGARLDLIGRAPPQSKKKTRKKV